jgi:hypothetical protein
MDRTHIVPVDDSLYNTYLDLCYDYQFSDAEYPERGEAALKAIRDFKAANPFKEVPLVKQQILLLGAGAAMRGYGKMRSEAPFQRAETLEERQPHVSTMLAVTYVTHPDNLPAFSAEDLKHFDVHRIKTQEEYMKDWGLVAPEKA